MDILVPFTNFLLSNWKKYW